MQSNGDRCTNGAAGSLLQVIGNGDPGGGTTAVLTLARTLHEIGERVAIVSQKGSYILDEAREHGLVAVGIEFSSRVATAATSRSLSALIADLRPDIVHAHGARAGLPVALARLLFSHRHTFGMVYTVHGFHFPGKRAGVRQLARLCEIFCMAQADHTIFVSASDSRIADIYRLVTRPGNTVIINNAISLGKLQSCPQRDIDIVFVGRLAPQKNVMILPDIVAALRPLRPNIHIVGGGELELELKERVRHLGLEEQFTYHGVQPWRQAIEIASRARTCILPSRWEGHPIVVIEAMHLGVPVVASRVRGNTDIVHDGVTGYLVDLEDVEGYARALKTLLINPSLHERLSTHARQVARDTYSPKRMLAQTQQVYGSVRARRIEHFAATGREI